MNYNSIYKYNKINYIKVRPRNYVGAGRKDKSNWQKMVEERKKELMDLIKTESFISKKKLSKKDKIYYIHDNGGRPLKVVANSSGISIFEITCYDKDNDEVIYGNLINKIKKFVGYWSGFDSSPYKMHGNSILIELSKKKYMYIGPVVYTFNSESEIIDYISPVGNSDVPYPVAYDKDNIYFMSEREYDRIDNFNIELKVANVKDIYSEFYDRYGSKMHTGKKMKKMKIINERVDNYDDCE